MLPYIKKHFYLLSLSILVVLVGLIVAFREKDPGLPPLKDRTGLMATGAEWANSKASIEALQEKIRQNPEDHKSMILLAQAYIQEGRLTGDRNYYDMAALKLLDQVLDKEPNDYEALCARATVLLSQHHFREGLETGLKAKQMYWHESYPYGILTDAYVELGEYEKAVQMVDSMCAIRPDLKSYSRISYVREIYGDLAGAIEAMKMAVQSGVPGMEQTEWCRVYLGRLYEQAGHADTAQMLYEASDQLRPNYAYAKAGLGRVEKAKKNYSRAIEYFEMADALVTDYSFGEELMDLYRLNGEEDKAEAKSKEVIALLNEHANSEDRDEEAGHYSDKELAYVYLKMNEPEKALKHAKAEYERRPANIDVNELMAWVYYKKGEYDKAKAFAEPALRTGCKNPQLLCRTALIFHRTNPADSGKYLLPYTVPKNPFMDSDVAKDVDTYLESGISAFNQ